MSKATKKRKDGEGTEAAPSLSLPGARRTKIARVEQIPRSETMELRRQFVGRSCKLFYKANPLKIVRAKGACVVYLLSFYPIGFRHFALFPMHISCCPLSSPSSEKN